MTDELKKIRKLVSDLVASAGCQCCRDDKGWYKAQKSLANILKIPKFKDGSGYDFYKFKSK